MKTGGLRTAALATLLALAACGTQPEQRANRDFAPGAITGPESELWDTPATLISGRSPVYPIRKVLDGRSGSASIAFTVSADGRTSDIEIVAATEPAFGDHAALAVRDWRFSPARMDGLAVASRFQITLDFSINRGYGPRRRD